MKKKKVLVVMLMVALIVSNFSGLVFAAGLDLNQTGSTVSSISFGWNAVTDATRYAYDLDNSGVPTDLGTATSKTVSSLAPGSTYSVKVVAYGEREVTEEVTTLEWRWMEVYKIGNGYNRKYYYDDLEGNPVQIGKNDWIWYVGTRYTYVEVSVTTQVTTTEEYEMTSQTVQMTTKQWITVTLNVSGGGVAVVDGTEYGPGFYWITVPEGTTISGRAYSNAGYVIASGGTINYTAAPNPPTIEVGFSAVGDTHSLPTYTTDGSFSGYHPGGSDISGDDPRGDVLSASMSAATGAPTYPLGGTAVINLTVDVTDGDDDTMTLNEVDIYHNYSGSQVVGHTGSVSDGVYPQSFSVPGDKAGLMTDGYSVSEGPLVDTYSKSVSFEMVDRYHSTGGAVSMASASATINVEVTAQHSLTWSNATASPSVSGVQDARAGGDVVFTANPATGIEDPATLTWSATGNQGTDNGDGTYTLTGLTADTHVTASYANKKLVQATSNNTTMGSVSPSSDYVGTGGSTTFTASVADPAYYRFVGWKDPAGNDLGSSPTLTVAYGDFEDGGTYQAIFEQYAEDVTFNTKIYNAVDTSTQVTTGTLGYVQFTMGGDTFTQNGTGGTITKTAVPYGTVVTIEGIPYDSYNYRSVAFKANPQNPRTVTITANKTSVNPSAVFAEKGTFVVTATYDANHVVFDKEGSLKDDETYTFVATPDSHTVITSATYMYAGTDVSLPMTDNLDGTFSVQLGNLDSDVHFTILSETTYNVSATSSNTEFGTVSPASQDYLEGSIATVVGTPATGYTLVSWTIVENGVTRSANPGNTLTFEVIGDTQVTANFVNSRDLLPDTYAVRVTSNLPAGGVFSGIGTGFTDGASYSVSLVSYDDVNYTFLGFSGATSGTIAGADVEVIALFEENIIDEPIPEEEPQPEPGQEDEPNEPVIEEKDEPVPEEQPTPVEEPEEEPEDEFLDEKTPEEAPDALPETGGFGAEILYGLGIVLSGIGTYIKKKK